MRKLILALLLATGALAQNPQDYDRYLVPVIQHNLRGANGSVWTAELLLRNRSSSVVNVFGPPPCNPVLDPVQGCSYGFDIAPNQTMERQPLPRGDGADGAFLYVQKSLNDLNLAITLHVRDTSQNATNFGTAIHLPLADEYQPQIDLIGIPTDSRYRGTLRIYGTTAAPQQVRVRTYDQSSDNILSEQILMLSGIVNIDDRFPIYPAYAQLDALPDSVHAADAQRIRITVDRMGENVSPPPPPIWAFVTITNNTTQLTSTITPNR